MNLGVLPLKTVLETVRREIQSSLGYGCNCNRCQQNRNLIKTIDDALNDQTSSVATQPEAWHPHAN